MSTNLDVVVGRPGGLAHGGVTKRDRRYAQHREWDARRRTGEPLRCKTCDGSLPAPPPGKRGAVYCSAACRPSENEAEKWRRRMTRHVCDFCGIAYLAVPKERRRFCTLACFGASLRKSERLKTESCRRRTAAYRRRRRRAPGLRDAAIAALLGQWRRQVRRCAYCPALCETVDHVVPVARHGTNWEGNLAPCCRACNSAKRDRLVIEWRAASVRV